MSPGAAFFHALETLSDEVGLPNLVREVAMSTYITLYLMLVFSHSKRFAEKDDVVCNNFMFGIVGLYNGLLMTVLISICFYWTISRSLWIELGILCSSAPPAPSSERRAPALRAVDPCAPCSLSHPRPLPFTLCPARPLACSAVYPGGGRALLRPQGMLPADRPSLQHPLLLLCGSDVRRDAQRILDLAHRRPHVGQSARGAPGRRRRPVTASGRTLPSRAGDYERRQDLLAPRLSGGGSCGGEWPLPPRTLTHIHTTHHAASAQDSTAAASSAAACRVQVRGTLCTEHAWHERTIIKCYVANVCLVLANVVCIFLLGRLPVYAILGINLTRARAAARPLPCAHSFLHSLTTPRPSLELD